MKKAEGWRQSGSEVTATYTPGTAGTPVSSVKGVTNVSFIAGAIAPTRPSALGWKVGTARNDGVMVASVLSSDMTAVVQLGNILATLQREGALIDYALGETRGQTIYASGHIPQEDLDAYLLVYSRVREAMEGQEFEVDLHLDSDAVKH